MKWKKCTIHRQTIENNIYGVYRELSEERITYVPAGQSSNQLGDEVTYTSNNFAFNIADPNADIRVGDKIVIDSAEYTVESVLKNDAIEETLSGIMITRNV